MKVTREIVNLYWCENGALQVSVNGRAWQDVDDTSDIVSLAKLLCHALNHRPKEYKRAR